MFVQPLRVGWVEGRFIPGFHPGLFGLDPEGLWIPAFAGRTGDDGGFFFLSQESGSWSA